MGQLHRKLDPADGGDSSAGGASTDGEQLDLDGYLDKFAEEFQEHGQEVCGAVVLSIPPLMLINDHVSL